MADLKRRNVRVGAGGWHEYATGRHGLRSDSVAKLRRYSREFDFVEVNATFYSIYYPPVLERWRKAVPADFEFAVKCYRGLTHEIGLRPVEDAYRVLDLMRKYCEILKSKILVMQMPPRVRLDDKFAGDARAFFSAVNLGDLRIAFEFRLRPDKIPAAVLGLLQDLNFVHAVDLAFEEPRIESDLLYSRVFGRSEKNNALDRDDLDRIKNRIEKSSIEEARIVGHSLKMIDDTRKIKRALSSGPSLYS